MLLYTLLAICGLHYTKFEGLDHKAGEGGGVSGARPRIYIYHTAGIPISKPLVDVNHCSGISVQKTFY